MRTNSVRGIQITNYTLGFSQQFFIEDLLCAECHLGYLEEIDSSDTDLAFKFRVEKMRCTCTSLWERKINSHEAMEIQEVQRQRASFLLGPGSLSGEGTLNLIWKEGRIWKYWCRNVQANGTLNQRLGEERGWAQGGLSHTWPTYAWVNCSRQIQGILNN